MQDEHRALRESPDTFEVELVLRHRPRDEAWERLWQRVFSDLKVLLQADDDAEDQKETAEAA